MTDQMETRGFACRFAPAREYPNGHDPAGAKRQASSFRRKRWAWSWAIFLLLAGYLLFAHGCHPDEDTELFARVVASRER